jgi:GH15 family glucan-1,4-alpha-glucosidase
MASDIGNYALIGDRRTAALVGRDCSIDWLCLPRFDSDACFAALVGSPDNGRWLIAPVNGAVKVARRYRDQTMILESEVAASDGAVTIVDFMPPLAEGSHVVRLICGKRGQVAMRTKLVIRFDYGSRVPWVTKMEDEALRAIEGPHMLVLRTPVRLRGEDLTTVGEFTVSAGETIPFVLSYGESYLPPPRAIDPAAALLETERYWRAWTAQARRVRRWEEPIMRSLITLQALTHQPSGAIVAAPTTSLPEHLGGNRNWDYRYCWLRDATFTLIALMNAGYYEDAHAWREWLLRAAAGDPDRLQIMYGITGEHRLPEWEVPWLDGYEGSRPVRVGNAAADQIQLDVYGEIIDALHQGQKGKLGKSDEAWAIQRSLLDHLEKIWDEPDHGIWEVRGDRQRFTHSKVMAWVAFDRAVKTVEQFQMDGPIDRWRAIRAAIHDEVCRYGFNAELGAFVQAYGSNHLDASTLLMPLVGFLPPQDPRVCSTVEAVQRHLVVDGFVIRYDTEAGIDGLPPGEGVFLPCSFWLADNLNLLGRRDEARALFERLLSLRNDVGLLSEEYDPRSKRMLGNFPQALSHIALVNTGYQLLAQNEHDRDKAASPIDAPVTAAL